MNKSFISIFLIVAVFSATQLNAQTKIDSLYTIWQDKTRPDSIRADAYYDYIWDEVLYKNPDSAFILAAELADFAEDKKLPKAKANAYNAQGQSSKLAGNFRQALDYYHRSLQIKEQLKDKKGIAGSLKNIGTIYRVQGYYPQALGYYERSLKTEKAFGYKRGIAQSLNNIGLIYTAQGNYPEALDYLQRSLKIKEQLKNKKGIAVSLNNIGNIYSLQGNNSQALEFFQRSLKIDEELGNNVGIARSLNNIGNVYRDRSDHENALYYYRRSLSIDKKIGHKIGTATSINNMGAIYNTQRKYNDAIKQCLRALEVSEAFELIDKQRMACDCLYKAYKGLNLGNKALVYHERLLVLKDSLQSNQTSKKLQQMEFAKQVMADSLVQVEKDLQVEMAHQTESRKKDKNRNIAIGIGVFFLLLSAGLYMRWRFVKKSKAVIEKEKDRSDNLLLNILPSEIAEELKTKGSADARDFDSVSILFTDFKGFTEASEKLTAKELIKEINVCFKAFDHICEAHGVEKIKTIGDAYMAAGGLPVPSEESVKNTVLAALEMQTFISNRIEEKEVLNEMSFRMRVGIHTGPVVAGIVGVKKFQYDIWGDTVNTASRMESSGAVGKVNISEDTYASIKEDKEFTFESRGNIEAKGKGKLAMFFVSKRD